MTPLDMAWAVLKADQRLQAYERGVLGENMHPDLQGQFRSPVRNLGTVDPNVMSMALRDQVQSVDNFMGSDPRESFYTTAGPISLRSRDLGRGGFYPARGEDRLSIERTQRPEAGQTFGFSQGYLSPHDEGMRRVQERKARGFLMHGANSPMPRPEGRGQSEFGQDILEHHPLAGMAGYTPQPSNRYDVLDERETAERAQASFDPESGELPDDLKPPNFQPMPPAIGQRGRLYDPRI